MKIENDQGQESSGREGQIVPSALAIAIVTRQDTENEKLSFDSRSVFGDKKYSSFEQQIQQSHHAIMIETMLRYPGLIKSNSEYTDKLFDGMSDVVCEMILFAGKPPETRQAMTKMLNPVKTRRILKNVHTAMLDLAPIDFDELPKQANEARRMSQELNVSPESIYLDNGLYHELIRRTSSPEKVVTDGLAYLGSMTKERFDSYVITAVTGIADVFIGEENLSEQEINEIRQMFINRVKKSMNFDAIVNERFPKFIQARAVTLKEKVNRVWGEKTFDNLPQELKLRIETYLSPQYSLFS